MLREYICQIKENCKISAEHSNVEFKGYCLKQPDCKTVISPELLNFEVLTSNILQFCVFVVNFDIFVCLLLLR